MFYLLQEIFGRDGLSQLWNELVRDGEVVVNSNDGLMNGSGVLSRKGMLYTDTLTISNSTSIR